MATDQTLIEKAVIRRLISELGLAGYVPVNVWDSEEHVPATTADAVIDTIFAVDADCTIHFAKKDELAVWGRRGVLIICGNGQDCVADYHCADKVFDAAIERVYEAINNGSIT